MTDNIRIIAISLGGLLVLSSLVDFQWLVSKLLFRKSTTVSTVNKEKDFLDIVSLWYQLKHKCDQFKLTVASDKLDEVFPLLNGVLEDEKTA